jgi:sugar phosphate isomerase/epimerase
VLTKREVQIKEKGMSLDLVNYFWLLTCLSKFWRHDQEKRKRMEERMAKLAKPAPACGAPNSVWCPGWPGGEVAALGNLCGDVAINHRTVR